MKIAPKGAFSFTGCSGTIDLQVVPMGAKYLHYSYFVNLKQAVTLTGRPRACRNVHQMREETSTSSA